MTVINFNEAMKQAKTASFDPLPDGAYDVVCIEATPTESSTNKPMIRLKYEVESGPQAGRKVFNQQVFSADNDAALAIFFRYMLFHGLDEAFFSANPAWEQVAAALVGRRVRLQLGHRMWQGQPRNEVNQVLPASTPATAPAPQQPIAQQPQLQLPQMAPVTQAVVPPAVPAAVPAQADSSVVAPAPQVIPDLHGQAVPAAIPQPEPQPVQLPVEPVHLPTVDTTPVEPAPTPAPVPQEASVPQAAPEPTPAVQDGAVPPPLPEVPF